MLHLLDGPVAEQPLGARQQDQEEEGKGDRLLVGAEIGRDEGLGQTDGHTSQDRSGDASEPPQNDDRQALESVGDAEVWTGHTEAGPDQGAGHSSEKSGDEEGVEDVAVDVDTEET